MTLAVASSNLPAGAAPRRGVPQGPRASIRELNACALRLPPGACPLASQAEVYYLPLVRDEGHPWAPLVPDIRWMDGRRIITQVCATRAIATVDATLAVAGLRRVSPERYLRHWRERITHSIAIEQAPWAFGLRPVARLEFDRRAVALAKTRWLNEPAGGLAGLLERHPALTSVRPDGDGAAEAPDPDAAQRLGLAVDLTAAQGASDAWWLQEYLRPGSGNPHPLKAWVECLPGRQALPQADTPQQITPACGAPSAPGCETQLECTP